MSLNARSYLFDAGAFFLFYSGEKRIKPYFDRVFSARALGFVSEVNLAELYHKTIEKFGIQSAEVWYQQVRQSRLQAVAPNETITRNAAIWKIKKMGISLADCFAIATMEEKADVLLTTDPALADTKGIKAVYISAK